MAKLTDAQAKDRRLNVNLTLSLNNVNTGTDFLTTMFANKLPPSHSKKVEIREQYFGNFITKSVINDDSPHVKLTLPTEEVREVSPQLYKWTYPVKNSDMDYAPLPLPFDSIFSPGSANDYDIYRAGITAKMISDTIHERQLVELVTTGKITTPKVNDNGSDGAAVEEDYVFDAWQKGDTPVGDSFRNANVEPGTFINGLIEQVVDNKGHLPEYCILGTSAATAFINNPAGRAAMNVINLEGNNMNIRSVQGYPAWYLATINNTKIYAYHGKYTDAAGNTQSMFPPNGLLLLPGKRTGALQVAYGRINRSEVNSPISFFYKVVEDETMGRDSMVAETRFIVATPRHKSFIYRNLLTS